MKRDLYADAKAPSLASWRKERGWCVSLRMVDQISELRQQSDQFALPVRACLGED
jgi:hypothetical protein